MKRPSYLSRWIMWNFFSRPFANIYVKFLYNYKIASGFKKFPKPPFMVVANHGTFFDPWIIGGYSPYPFAYMVNDDGFRGKGLSPWYLRSIGAIPKKKGASDFKAMKTTMNYLNNKEVVCIFPEGQTTWDGETQLAYKGLEKIVKKVSCPLVMVHLKGNFLTKPWWANTLRKGRILLDFKILEKDEIEKLTSDEIFDKIRSYIMHNDIKDSDNLSYPFSGKKLAEGLERFVWVCMHCGKEDTLTTNDNTIHCTACGKKWDIDAHCRLSPHDKETTSYPDLKDWADYHKSFVLEKIQHQNALITESSGVVLQLENESGEYEDKESGTLRLDPTGISFTSASGTTTWPLAEIDNYVIQKKDIFEFRHKEKDYRVSFNKQSVMKWIYYIRYLKGYTKFEEQGYL